MINAKIREKRIFEFSGLDLVHAREAAGLSQEDLARRVGVSQPDISFIENQKSLAWEEKKFNLYNQALCGVG